MEVVTVTVQGGPLVRILKILQRRIPLINPKEEREERC